MFESIRENLHVYYSPNYGSNLYVLIGKKIAVIDASLCINRREILSGLEALGIAPRGVDMLLFSHGHADHFGCASLFPKAEKRMHALDAEKMELRDAAFAGLQVFNEKEFPKIKSTFKEGETIDFKPFSLKVLFTPGHTAGSACFFDEKLGLLFSGDTLFAGSCGRTDLPTGDDAQMAESLEFLSALKHSILLPGHGLILKNNAGKNASDVLKTFRHQYL